MFLTVSFEEKKISILMKFNLFLKIFHAFIAVFKKSFLNPRSPKAFPLFTSTNNFSSYIIYDNFLYCIFVSYVTMQLF